MVVIGDSLMVIRETRNITKNRKNPSAKMHYLLKCIVNDFKAINFLHVLRAYNQQADIMANKGAGLNCGVLVCDQKAYDRNWIP